jgi:threonyl-tRNA synthetase
MHVLLPDGTRKELEDGATGADLAAAIGPGLARAALAIKSNGHLRDLARPLADGEQVEIVTDRSPESLELIRHDTAHVLAAAVLDLYPGTKISIGPPIEDGFYYDFEFPDGVTVSDGDLTALEERMREHVKAEEPFTREDVTVDEALDRFRAEDQPYKVELIEDLVRDEGVDTVSLYTNGPFTDLCRGPHAPSTGRIKAFKLLSLAGAYWRGDANRQMLTRIYGTAFHSKKDLEEHLHRLEQARARDHRKLGRELNLFMFSELSPGMPFWQPDGMVVLNALTDLWRRENAARGYREVKTPILYDAELFRMSGHWDVYRDNMYFTDVEERTMGLKPMNCPAHIQLYKDARHSYRDLPIRYSEAGLVHRHEPSGTLHGLLRVRHITQDDAHIFCAEDQIEDEVNRCLDFGYAIYDTFGFEPRLELSTRPEKRIGAEEMWDRAEAASTTSTPATARSTAPRSTCT